MFEILEEPNLHENSNLAFQPSFIILPKRSKFLISFLLKCEGFEKKNCYLDVFKASYTFSKLEIGTSVILSHYKNESIMGCDLVFGVVVHRMAGCILRLLVVSCFFHKLTHNILFATGFVKIVSSIISYSNYISNFNTQNTSSSINFLKAAEIIKKPKKNIVLIPNIENCHRIKIWGCLGNMQYRATFKDYFCLLETSIFAKRKGSTYASAIEKNIALILTHRSQNLILNLS